MDVQSVLKANTVYRHPLRPRFGEENRSEQQPQPPITVEKAPAKKGKRPWAYILGSILFIAGSGLGVAKACQKGEFPLIEAIYTVGSGLYLYGSLKMKPQQESISSNLAE